MQPREKSRKGRDPDLICPTLLLLKFKEVINLKAARKRFIFEINK